MEDRHTKRNNHVSKLGAILNGPSRFEALPPKFHSKHEFNKDRIEHQIKRALIKARKLEIFNRSRSRNRSRQHNRARSHERRTHVDLRSKHTQQETDKGGKKQVTKTGFFFKKKGAFTIRDRNKLYQLFV